MIAINTNARALWKRYRRRNRRRRRRTITINIAIIDTIVNYLQLFFALFWCCICVLTRCCYVVAIKQANTRKPYASPLFGLHFDYVLLVSEWLLALVSSVKWSVSLMSPHTHTHKYTCLLEFPFSKYTHTTRLTFLASFRPILVVLFVVFFFLGIIYVCYVTWEKEKEDYNF